MPAMAIAIEPLDPALFELEPDPNDLEAEAARDAEEYAAWAHVLEDQLTNTSSTDLQPNIDIIEPTLQPAVDLLDEVPLDDLAARDPDLAAAIPEIDERLTAAVNAMPGEGWVDPPAPFEPPDDPGFDPGEERQPPPEGPPPPPPELRTRVNISNSSRLGATDYRVGDWVRVGVTGQPGGIVSVEAWQDGALLGTLEWPDKPVNNAGLWSNDSFLSDDTVGAWIEVWRVGEVQADPILMFEVLGG